MEIWLSFWGFFQVNATALSALFTLFGTLAVIVTALIALPQIIVIKRTQHLESILTFLEITRNVRMEREFVYREMPIKFESLVRLTDNERKRIEVVVTSLNDVGLLLEDRAIPKKQFFGIYHQMIIRLWYKLQHYVNYYESRRGGRYGRRLERLDKRAKLYHDIYPIHRRTNILLDTGIGEPIKIYETQRKRGFKSIGQRTVWAFIRIFKLY